MSALWALWHVGPGGVCPYVRVIAQTDPGGANMSPGESFGRTNSFCGALREVTTPWCSSHTFSVSPRAARHLARAPCAPRLMRATRASRSDALSFGAVLARARLNALISVICSIFAEML